MRALFAGAALMLAVFGAQGAETPIEPFQFASPAQEARFKRLLGELRCLVCQNQSLADSEASLAADIRHRIHKMMRAGASDEEIVAFLVDRYGDFVLFRPPVKPVTYLLWAGPALLLVLGAAAFAAALRRRLREPEPELTEQERRRAQELLDRGGPDP